jgi:hypothetical protein
MVVKIIPNFQTFKSFFLQIVKQAFHQKINAKFVKQTIKKSPCVAKTILYILQTVENE